MEGLTTSISSSHTHAIASTRRPQPSRRDYLRESDVDRDEIEGIMFDLEGYEDLDNVEDAAATLDEQTRGKGDYNAEVGGIGRGESRQGGYGGSERGGESGSEKAKKKVGWCGSVQWRAPETVYEYTDKSDVFR